MLPAFTSLAPIQITATTPVKIKNITIAVIKALIVTLFRVASYASSVSFAKSVRDTASWVNAWTVWEANKLSEAFPELSAILSWFILLNTLTRRPIPNIGIKIKGTINNTSPVNLAEVINNKIKPPTNIIALRSAYERYDPITERINVVSVVILLKTSPVMMRS